MEHKIILDLMPLYLDGVASDESRQAIEEHVAVCAECRAALDAMRASGSPAVPDTDITPLRKVKAIFLWKLANRHKNEASLLCQVHCIKHKHNLWIPA